MVTFGVVLAGVGLVSWAAPASANAGPHGGYTLTTSACAGCHRAHTAVSPYLLKADDEFALCTSCHGGNVTTDVLHGVQTGATKLNGDPKPLNGGGFVETAGGVPVTSRHNIDGLPGSGPTLTAWGSQNGDGTPVADVGVGVQGDLECTSCHNPHGSTNYRILNDAGTDSNKWVPNDPDLLKWVSYQVLATRDDAPNYGFDNGNINDCPPPNTPVGASPTPYGGLDPNGNGTGNRCKLRYTSGVLLATPAAAYVTTTPGVPAYLGMSAFCATCHKSYLTLSGSAQNQNSLNTPVNTPGPGTPTPIPAYLYPGIQDANDGHGDIARYRHAVEKNRSLTSYPKQALRFAALGIDPNPPSSSKYGTDNLTPAAPGYGVNQVQYRAFSCETCHYAHGSSAAATPAPGDLVPEGPAGDSALLFYGNRGVCISCHQTVGNPPAPTPTP
jgi:predicted CXXCH cytochrome family protein